MVAEGLGISQEDHYYCFGLVDRENCGSPYPLGSFPFLI